VFAELTFLCEWYCGVNIIFYGTEEDFSYLGYESALVIPNHRSDVDWLIGWSLSDRAGTLGVRYIVQLLEVNIIAIASGCLFQKRLLGHWSHLLQTRFYQTKSENINVSLNSCFLSSTKDQLEEL